MSVIFYDDSFEDGTMDAWDPSYRYPFPDFSDHQLFVAAPGDGPTPEERYVRWVAATYNCPNCGGLCGTPDAPCYVGASLYRDGFQPGLNEWRHCRALVRPMFSSYGILHEDFDFPMVVGLLTEQPPWILGGNPPGWPENHFGFSKDGPYFDGLGSSFVQLSPSDVPVGEWTCVELAMRYTSPDALEGEWRGWINGVLKIDAGWDIEPIPGNLETGFFGAHGMMAGSWGGNVSGPGKIWDVTRLTFGSGPIGCSRRGPAPGSDVPDPDAEKCTWDEYDTECEVSGECGRVQLHTGALTREAAGWETFGAGFPSTQSGWFKWTCPRSGKYIWRTRGSQVFNEIGVYRHTGTTPPPLVPGGFSDDDDWDPGDPFSSAVEIVAEAGVEYRIRVASTDDGWIVVNWGPARVMMQDDGWGMPTNRPETLTRVFGVGSIGGVVRDDQVASGSNGAGTSPTLSGVTVGTELP